jgi:hypothetical protein
LDVAGGAQLLTLHARQGDGSELPLVSLLRDSLGDTDSENDRLRYVWVFTYTRPSLAQRAMASVPFLYNKVASKDRAKKEPPPPIVDLADSRSGAWHRVFWAAVQNIFLDSQGFAIRASTRTYKDNAESYRKAHLLRALAILSLYESETDASPVFTKAESREIQARLLLTESMLGSFVDDIYLQKIYQKQTSKTLDTRGHNWELLRQRAEAEGLYFEPLELPDGGTTHAVVWVARKDLALNRPRSFNPRFLNIKNPWRDKKLRNWKGYVQTKYVDGENRPAEPGTPGAIAVEMIPLAVYGLDHPHVPALLVDFRDKLNPKRREVSRRATNDIVRNVLSLSRFGDPRYFLARAVYDLVTGRSGMDVNQPSRLRSYSQLKLLLWMNESLSPELREEIAQRLEQVSLNPMENDSHKEEQLAREQYAALMDYASRPDGLPARLKRDRGEELTRISHGRAERTLLHLANVFSFGLYKHREAVTAKSLDGLDLDRKLAYHKRLLREVVQSGPQIDVVWNMDEVRRSLRFIAQHHDAAGSEGARIAARVFFRTKDDETRLLCLDSLHRANNKTARKELAALYSDERVDLKWRLVCLDYLLTAAEVGKTEVVSTNANNDD